MTGDDDVYRTIAGEDEQACRFLATSEHPEKIERRIVAPMEVLEHEDERHLRGQHFERLRHLAQHALLRDAEELAPQRLAIVPAHDPWQLHDPRRRISLEKAKRPIAPGFAEQAPQGLEDR
jgi:hypothetical protein